MKIVKDKQKQRPTAESGGRGQASRPEREITMTYTYTQTTDKNGKARFYRVDENGKRKVISRTEYEANTSEQISIEAVAQTAEAVEVEVPAAQVVAAEGETVYTEEPVEAPAAETCTALVVPFNLEAVVAELREHDRLNSIEMTAHGLVDTALETVKAIIAGLGGKHSKKVRVQETKKGVQIRYRNCAVCALVLDAEKNLTGIRFMGTTMETVNEATVREPAGLDTYADEIAAQVAFIDWWWANASKKAAA